MQIAVDQSTIAALLVDLDFPPVDAFQIEDSGASWCPDNGLIVSLYNRYDESHLYERIVKFMIP